MQVKDIEIPEGETLIDIVPDKITLENGTVVSDPVGNLSSSFTISAQVILAERDYVRQLNNIFRKVGLEIDGIVPITLAERNLILDKNELHDNIMLLDIGAGNTDIGVFEGTTFLYTNSIPLGGDNITNDITTVGCNRFKKGLIIMNQDERRIFLIKELLKEDKRYKNIEIPKNPTEQVDLLRALMNVRMPKEISEEFLKV